MVLRKHDGILNILALGVAPRRVWQRLVFMGGELIESAYMIAVQDTLKSAPVRRQYSVWGKLEFIEYS